ncbi:MAG: glutaredoxin domain-containing protein [Cyanobacteria bacterium J06639_14]
MSNCSTIHIFTKPGCPYCERAKAVLTEAGLSYVQHDVKASQRNANGSIYASGVATVPQIFFGDYHINGAEDLEALQQAGSMLELAWAKANNDLQLDQVSDAELARGAEDVLLREHIPSSDGSRDDDPESWPALHFYKQLFGFWPNCFEYLHPWPEAYKLFMYCQNIPAVKMAQEILGEAMMYACAFATSNAHGCNYCQVHAATGDEASVGVMQQLKAAREGNYDGAIGPFEVALADLAAAATTNQVTPELLARIRELAPQSRNPSQNADQSIIGAGLMAASLGFLNVFNDLTGVEVEGDLMQKGKAIGIEAGRHGASEANPSNLDYDIPEDGPSIAELAAKYEDKVGDLNAYAQREFGVMPAWFGAFPAAMRKRHAYLYGEIVGERAHTIFAAELKHLMLRVAAIARGHDNLAADEAFMAYHTSRDSAVTLQRIKLCFAVATGRTEPKSLFSAREHAALQLAWLSAQQPLTTPQRFVQPVIDTFEPAELVHLITVCSISSLIQRFSAVTKPEIAPKVVNFLGENDIETQTLAIRYPMPTDDLAASREARRSNS